MYSSASYLDNFVHGAPKSGQRDHDEADCYNCQKVCHFWKHPQCGLQMCHIIVMKTKIQERYYFCIQLHVIQYNIVTQLVPPLAAIVPIRILIALYILISVLIVAGLVMMMVMMSRLILTPLVFVILAVTVIALFVQTSSTFTVDVAVIISPLEMMFAFLLLMVMLEHVRCDGSDS